MCESRPALAARGKTSRMLRRIALAAVIGVALAGAWSPARAQMPAAPSPAPTQSGWTFNVAPYLWLPWFNAKVEYKLPPALDGRVPTTISTGPGDYLSHLNFSAMGAAEADYGRFSALMDFVWTSFSATSADMKSVNFARLPPHPVSKSVQLSTGTNIKTTLLTLSGGYTVTEGAWGNFVVLAGVRGMQANVRTNYSLALNLVGPRNNGASFGGIGYLGAIENIWNGIAGFRGRIMLPVTGLFIPYYFDIGAGGSQLTWQVATGLGYQTGWVGGALLFRYISFEQGNSSVVRHLDMGGPMLMVNFSF
jgi:hypothetical protein